METSAQYGLSLPDNKIIRTAVSGKELRREFCRNMVEWAIVANRKGVTLDVGFEHALPDYALPFRSERIFTETMRVFMETSLDRTAEGIIRVSINALKSSADKWWLTIKVYDTGAAIHAAEIDFVNGPLRQPADSLRNRHFLMKLKKLGERIGYFGGEMELLGIAGILPGSRSWNNCYVARLPCQDIALALGNKSFQENSLA
ncbi:MAG: hypothetical protein P1P81_02120 [Desulfobulbales bacterium]|nr:hypothetical protein [Desulfobulbales bacterium]